MSGVRIPSCPIFFIKIINKLQVRKKVMQPLRGTRDVLPDEIFFWQYIQARASNILALANYHEIRTPMIESTSLFKRSIGNGTDIVNKEMYNFIDQGAREITLKPEGTASIARAFISNKLYQENTIKRLWYLSPMFRYERPQNGRQRQFHQLGIECIGSSNPMADVEVIRLAKSILDALECSNYRLEINSIGNLEERNKYKQSLINYLQRYTNDLDNDSQKKLYTNPLKILDSKNIKTQEILYNGPSLYNYLTASSKKHFETVCEYLSYLKINYTTNYNLVRGLDYYNYTAFEIKTNNTNNQNTICGGGRYDSLIKQLGGPDTPSVGWAIGVERLLLIIQEKLKLQKLTPIVYIATEDNFIRKEILEIIQLLEKRNISYELDFHNHSLQKQLKKADKMGVKACIILRSYEIMNKCITLKKLENSEQEQFSMSNINQLIQQLESIQKN
uniref:histidine-tRNA ligase n=1 Tax=Catenella fusiformis TaxID=3024791 RepID=UPI0027DA95E7|nr:histidine-tRNA ligase [Catenella fusiformis]WCH57616.1 histidine-tRNA ligase [Catenella fusiformis]